jgi:hypothetical protein
MWASSGFCILSSALVSLCRDDKAGLRCGPCACLLGGEADDARDDGNSGEAKPAPV